MIIINQENTPKKRGRPKKIQDTTQVKSSITDAKPNLNNYTDDQLRSYEATKKIFKKLDGISKPIEHKNTNYDREVLEQYLSDPIQYSSYLININNYAYNVFGLYRDFIEYLYKPILYRWTVKVNYKTIAFDKVKPDKLKKDYVTFCNRIDQLKLEYELQRLILKMLLEDAVFGYWLEDGNNSTIYYLPYSWCKIRSVENGLWAYHIDSKKPSAKEIEYLPKELQSLINKYRSKSGDEALAPVPYEKCVCFKYNNHVQYLMPPFSSVILSILDVMRAKEIEMAKSENDAMNIIALKIPHDAKSTNSLLLTADFIEPFVLGAQDLMPNSQVGILPTPLEPEVLQLSKTQTTDSNIVKNAMQSLDDETGKPRFGGSENASVIKRALESSQSKIYTLLDQISNSINLKLKLEGFDYPSYFFRYEILHICEFNKTDYVDKMLKDRTSGAINAMEIEAARGLNPLEYMAHSYFENNVLRGIIDNLAVPPSSHTQSSSNSSDGVGAPRKSEEDLTESGRVARERETNDDAQRDI